MSQDLCVKMEEGVLNIRVGAIIMKGDKFLMVENDRFPHMYSVGGRIKFGETAEEAVVREVFEETGCKIEIIDFLGTIEELKTQGFRVIIEPAKAVAFDGKRVVFMMNLGMGLMEIVEE